MPEAGITAESVAEDIILLSRNSLLVNFRFLDRAIHRLEFVPDENVSICTDGEAVYYGPAFILSLYKRNPQLVSLYLLHSVLHCIFRHNLTGAGIDRHRWDLSADIAAEYMISSFGGPIRNPGRESLQKLTVETILKEVGEPVTAERIYSWLAKKDFPDDELDAQRECFLADGHGIWYGSSDSDAKTDRNISLRKIWEDVSRRMQTELETISRDSGSALVQSLKSLNRSRRSYTEFLKRFGVHGEVMRLSDEEFDNIYYTYGMDMYGDIPLIEPLEYSEQKRIRDFVIAIDTSGSVRGDVVQSFIQHTHDILMRRESFFSKINLYIIQCDHVIRDVAVIKSGDDFAGYMDTLEIKGLGATDFRPVFSYVDGLIRQKKLTGLQGLIYFTDGLGTFPEERPDYDTAFIVRSDGTEVPDIPIWAQHLTISEDDILDRRFSDY